MIEPVTEPVNCGADVTLTPGWASENHGAPGSVIDSGDFWLVGGRSIVIV